jgi:undecaprenyl-diphosphatase
MSTEHWRHVKRWLPHGAAAILLAVVLGWDRELFAAIEGFRSPFLTWLTDRVSQLRGATFPCALGLLLIAIGLIARRTRLRRAGVAVVLTIVLAGTITSIMKEVIARPGPEVDDAVPGHDTWLDARFGRFPSSHSAITFGAASALTAFVPAAAAPAYLFAVLVCHERLYRGTHFPSDILAGIWIGLVAARFVLAKLARRGWMDDLTPARSKQPAREVPDFAWKDEKLVSGDQDPVA